MSVSAEGEIRVWENMSLGLGNMDRYQEAYIEMGQDDIVDKLWRLDVSWLVYLDRVYRKLIPQGTNLVITTRQSFVYRVIITVSAGRATPTIVPFTVSRGMFSRATPAIFNNDDDKHGIVSVASSGSTAYVLAWRKMQRWSISQDSQKVSWL